MSELKHDQNAAGHFLRGALLVTAVVILVGAVVIAGLNIVDASQHGQPPVQAVLFSLGSILLGVVVAVALIAFSGIIGLLSTLLARTNAAPADDLRPAIDRIEQSLRLLNTAQSRPETRGGEVAGVGGGAHSSHLLEQIRDLTLMDEAQRQRLAQRHWARRKLSQNIAIERDVLVGDWVSAFARLEELQVVLPEDPQIIELSERVESEQTSRLDEDLRAARARLRHLMSATLWQQADDLVATLQQKYPGKAETERLAEDVRRERDNYERESMERLFRDIAAATERKQWRQALLALEEFVRRYPLDPRAEKLRLDMPTLQENAASHERKEQEEHFKDLLKRQRYEEAVGVARAVIRKYPQSPTATELNKLLPRVEEMARQAQAAPVPVPATATA